jgi:hypothetical protein
VLRACPLRCDIDERVGAQDLAILGCGFDKIHNFLIHEWSNAAYKTGSDRLTCLALLDPDFMRFAEFIVPLPSDRC